MGSLCDSLCEPDIALAALFLYKRQFMLGAFSQISIPNTITIVEVGLYQGFIYGFSCANINIFFTLMQSEKTFFHFFGDRFKMVLEVKLSINFNA